MSVVYNEGVFLPDSKPTLLHTASLKFASLEYKLVLFKLLHITAQASFFIGFGIFAKMGRQSEGEWQQ